MIIVYHRDSKVTAVDGVSPLFFSKLNRSNIAQTLFLIASENPNVKIVWCHESVKKKLNLTALDALSKHKNVMLSYKGASDLPFQNVVGYIEQSPFIKVNHTVTYPTWCMSSTVGVIHASVLERYKSQLKPDVNLDYFLCSIAKIGMIKGLFCYAAPQLLFDNQDVIHEKPISTFAAFKFVSQHFKKQWVFFLFFMMLVYEKRLAFFPLLKALFFKSRLYMDLNFESLMADAAQDAQELPSIDVIIPTLGRKVYLYDVLLDLAAQSHLPVHVIVIEQNPVLDSISELEYLQEKHWPFVIKHIFTHQTGACNARNLALDLVESDWVFLGDDDNRFGQHLIRDVLQNATKYGLEAITTAYLQQGETQIFNTIHQSGIFGSGNSFVAAPSLKNIRFDKALEFGYGEDTDFGLQLRNSGCDIIYFPSLRITHLKAPSGGFRTPLPQLWEQDYLQPKPSPTILYVYLKHFTLEQLKGFKLLLFLKLLKKEPILKSILFVSNFNKKWERSIFWAQKLKIGQHEN
ncbi:glycosyltransferase family 2 protein [Flavobacterium sp. CHNK8]|uniref:glycosyltransferase family 2 protein n=1 Tax=Flavobacterium sp. CHNK8 TaxID=2871165 RepID=UPI001C8EE8D3|nr:glycosyltransferase family A protein [Flavobacterium sp. CHNK8]QZK89639.1 glycosyltransferase family 2 protein [Flavobacterium sp. CHNK8]